MQAARGVKRTASKSSAATASTGPKNMKKRGEKRQLLLLEKEINILEEKLAANEQKERILDEELAALEEEKMRLTALNRDLENELQDTTNIHEGRDRLLLKDINDKEQVEVSMVDRLANLTVDIKSRSKTPINQNLTKLLVQGLHSNDKGLILTVLQSSEPRAAAGKTSQLVLHRGSYQNICASVCTWLSAALRCHSALLLATLNSETAGHLTQLLAIFTHRRSELILKGRIDLSVTQRGVNDDDVEQRPVLQYNDSSSE